MGCARPSQLGTRWSLTSDAKILRLLVNSGEHTLVRTISLTCGSSGSAAADLAISCVLHPVEA